MNKVLSTSETWFLFGLPPLSSMSFSPAEVTVSHEMQGNWTAFATTGIVDDFLPWKPLAPDFVDIRTAISKNEGVPASNPECDFWDSFTPNPIVSLLVPTENGIIIGSQNGFVLEFKGIPYAAPPIGDFRFMPPQPAPSWIPTSRPAVDFGPSCLQPPSARFPSDQQSEDCLSLNVFVPDGTYINSSLPVLVWIHGGAFRSGGSSAYDAELLTGVLAFHCRQCVMSLISCTNVIFYLL
jgi:carboxylesterase type B